MSHPRINNLTHQELTIKALIQNALKITIHYPFAVRPILQVPEEIGEFDLKGSANAVGGLKRERRSGFDPLIMPRREPVIHHVFLNHPLLEADFPDSGAYLPEKTVVFFLGNVLVHA